MFTAASSNWRRERLGQPNGGNGLVIEGRGEFIEGHASCFPAKGISESTAM